MAATSPYSGNDYQAVSNFRPYELPVNDIFKSISAQNQFWDAGAARVKSYYDKGSNLDLTSTENRKIRDQFIKDSEKELIKLSSMNLADPSVQKKGMSIFKPLFKDKAILQDDYLTRKQKEIYSEAEKYKNDEKTKGTGFHMDNLAYALMPFRSFGENTSRAELDSIFNKAKNSQYIPHYDFSKERMDILEQCKPDKFSNTTGQGMYLDTDKDSSLTKSKLWGCLNTALSPQATQQIRISAAVRYNNDYGTLKNDYIESASSEIKAYKSEVSKLAAKKAAIAGNKQYAEIENGYAEEIKMYEAQINRKSDDLLKINGWDEKYISDRYEDLAYSAYFKRINEPFAQAFSRMDIERDKKANPVSMMMYVQQKMDDRQTQAEMHDYNMEDYKTKLKMLYGGDGDSRSVSERMRLGLASGMISPEEFQKVYGSAVEEEQGQGFDAINTLVGDADKNINSKFSEIKRYLEGDEDLAKIVADVKTPEDFNKKIGEINTFLSTATKNPNTPAAYKAAELIEAMNSYVGFLNTKTHYQAILDDAWSSITVTNKELFEGRYLKDIEPLNIGGKQITANEVVDALDGISQKYDIRKYYITTPSYTSPTTFVTTPGTKVEEMQLIDKKTGEVLADLGKANSKYNRWFGSILEKQLENSNDRNKAVNNILKQRLATQRQTIVSGNLLDEKNFDPRVKESVESAFGKLPGNVKFSTVGNFNPVTGEVEIQGVNSKGQVLSYKELRDAAAEAKADFGQGAFTEGSRGTSIRVKIPALQIIRKPEGFDSIESLVDYGASKVMDNPNLARGFDIFAGFTPHGNSVSVKVEKGIGSGMPKYSIVLQGADGKTQQLLATSKSDAINGLQKYLSGELDKEIK